ncbi:MAG: dCTP deaminase [Candidatus Thermoplasmatota archaeon]|nr:dCTP deaminase [Candidatus Thermoplasmatota archaeon]MDA8142894.1 dCTP deaminase [Thermoplasmatales archaeon]
MTVLCDADILKMAERNDLISEEFSKDSLTPNGYDLRIAQISLDGENMQKEVSVKGGDRFLVSTLEYISLPDNIVGQIWIRSSYARRGVLGSFGAVDSGFKGNLTLSFFHAGKDQLQLRSGERIAQIIFHKLENISEKSYKERSGNYQGSRGITVKGGSE